MENTRDTTEVLPQRMGLRFLSGRRVQLNSKKNVRVFITSKLKKIDEKQGMVKTKLKQYTDVSLSKGSYAGSAKLRDDLFD